MGQLTIDHYEQVVERLMLVVRQLAQADNAAGVMALARGGARQLLRADGASFILREGDTCHHVDEEAIAPLWRGQRLPIWHCVSGWSMLNARALVISDLAQDPRVPPATYSATFVKAVTVVPVGGDDPLGAIAVYWDRLHTPTAEEVRLLKSLADTAAIALGSAQRQQQAARLAAQLSSELDATKLQLQAERSARERAEESVRELSLKDDLTGVYNRRGFILLAEQELKLAQRAGRDCLLLYLDVDHLKHVNDTHGHAVGDALIADAARLLKNTFRDADVIGRLGGDEFAVLLAESDASATAVKTRLQRLVDQFNRDTHSRYRLSFSIGAATWLASAREALELLIARADSAMYVEKRLKRSNERAA